jgi:hypothetical protein
VRIENQGFPYAGQRFRFVVAGAIGRTTIEAYVDTRRVLEAECPDPPCHEVVLVPVSTRGSVLRLIATDSLGNRIERVFTIADSEASAGGMIATAG